jgi:hypothetical protein
VDLEDRLGGPHLDRLEAICRRTWDAAEISDIPQAKDLGYVADWLLAVNDDVSG